MSKVRKPTIRNIKFTITTGVGERSLIMQMINEFSGTISCYDDDNAVWTYSAGTIEGFYINSNYWLDAMNADIEDQARWNEYFDEDVYKVLTKLFNLEPLDGSLSGEVRDLSGCDVENADVLVISNIYLKPEFRHKKLGSIAIQATINQLSKSARIVAMRISPAQMDMDWDYHSAVADRLENEDIPRNQREGFLAQDVQEFESLTDQEAKDKLLSHFGEMGFRKLSYSDILMVTSTKMGAIKN